MAFNIRRKNSLWKDALFEHLFAAKGSKDRQLITLKIIKKLTLRKGLVFLH
jgi:hypothetical protein